MSSNLRNRPDDLLSCEEESAQLRRALESRDVIGQAKGIVRLLTGADSDGAFAILAKISTDTNIKVRQIAEVIAECAASGQALPPVIARSWQQHTRTPSPAGPRMQTARP